MPPDEPPKGGAAPSENHNAPRRRPIADGGVNVEANIRDTAAALAKAITDARDKGYVVRTPFQLSHLEAISVSAGAKAIGEDVVERKISA